MNDTSVLERPCQPILERPDGVCSHARPGLSVGCGGRRPDLGSGGPQSPAPAGLRFAPGQGPVLRSHAEGTGSDPGASRADTIGSQRFLAVLPHRPLGWQAARRATARREAAPEVRAPPATAAAAALGLFFRLPLTEVPRAPRPHGAAE